MAITFDPAERDATLAGRGLDFADSEQVFAGPLVENRDDRFDYGKERWITVGLLRGRMVVVVWTWRAGDRHVISLRKPVLSYVEGANDKEQRRYEGRMG